MKLYAIVKPFCDNCPARCMEVFEDESIIADGKVYMHGDVKVRCANFVLCTHIERHLTGKTAPLQRIDAFSADSFDKEAKDAAP